MIQTFKYLFFLLLTTAIIQIFLSCGKANHLKTVPQGIIKPDKMVEILVDIHVAESGIEHSGLNPDSIAQYYTDYYYAIFKKYGISKDKFLKSTEYYFKNPAKFEEIYIKVTEKLEQLNAEKWD